MNLSTSMKRKYSTRYVLSFEKKETQDDYTDVE